MKIFRCQIFRRNPYGMMIDFNREPDVGVFEEGIILFKKQHIHRLILLAYLVVVAVFPEDTDSDDVLMFFICTPHVRPGEETEAAAVCLQGLINGKFHGKIGDAFAILGRVFIGVLILCFKKVHARFFAGAKIEELNSKCKADTMGKAASQSFFMFLCRKRT